MENNVTDEVMIPIADNSNTNYTESQLVEIMNFALADRYKKMMNIIKNQAESYIIADCTKENLRAYLKRPYTNQKNLRNMSRKFYEADGHYRRLVHYPANMVKFSYVIESSHPLDEKIDKTKYAKEYMDIARRLDNMNIRTEFNKPLVRATRDGVAYCYACEERDAFKLNILDPDYCRMAFVDASGCIRFEFDFSFFDRVRDNIREAALISYGDEFVKKYNDYKHNGVDKWQILDEDSMCIKYDEDILEYSIPPFIAVIDSLFDLYDYKSLTKAKEENGNYNLLGFKIPTTPDGKILMDLGLAKKFVEQATSEIPDTIGILLSPMDIEKYNFAKESSVTENNAVSNAEQQFWSSSGVSDLLFGSSKSATNSLNKSIIADQIDVFAVVRQIERWINRRLMQKNKSRKFKIKFLDVTSFNEQDMFDLYKKAGDTGLPDKIAISSVLGFTPFETLSNGKLENDVLNVRETTFSQPLYSSSQMSSTDLAEGTTEEGGRPTLGDDEISDKGMATRENDGNIRE